MPGKGPPPQTPAGEPPARVIAGLEPDPVTRRLLELYLTPLGYTLHWIASLEEWPGSCGAAAVFLLAASAPLARDATSLRDFATRLGAVPLLGMAGDLRRFPPETVPFPVRQVLRKPVRADELLAALESLHKVGPSLPVPVTRAPGADARLEGFEAMIQELDMDAATVVDLCQSFLQRGDQYLRELRAAAQPRDDAALDRVAHGLKGMAGNLRFRRMTEISDQLRKAAKAQAGDPAPLIQDLAAEFGELRKVLEERWLQAGAAAGKDA